MPGTIASITDPALVSSTTTTAASASAPANTADQDPTTNLITTAAQSSTIAATAADPTALASATASPFNSPPGSRRPSAGILNPLPLLSSTPQLDPISLQLALQQQAADPKATIVSTPAQHTLIDPIASNRPGTGGPGSGVALTSASSNHAILHSAQSSSIAPSNTPARMTTALARNDNMASSASGLHQRKKIDSLTNNNNNSAHGSKNSNLVQFVETPGHFSLVRNFHLADAFTLMNGFCGAQSLFASGRYLITSDPIHAWHALWFPLFGAIFDLLDGKVARWRNSSSMLGQELDSLADSTSFGAAPAFAAFALGLRLPLDTLILTGFVCAGIARLARFNVTTASIPHDASGKARYFEGLPIPSSLILVGGMALCLLFGRFDTAGGNFVNPSISTAGSAGWWSSAQLLHSTEGSTAWSAVKALSALPTGRKLVFTGRFAKAAAASSTKASQLLGKAVQGSATGVPLGVLNLDVFGVVEKFLGAEFAAEWASVHTISLLWLAWSAAMVSKTLRVPKP
ncbi:CDP-diacylglycerol-serine O-phosphatidyltransferase [Tilletia horrida]|nr:CDP-diacylglycerol-serine O-phosphatidyltransferase [Tilletia horrida]